ncbi:MAG: peptidylprolyl isomerase [Actinomycetota bacterium]
MNDKRDRQKANRENARIAAAAVDAAQRRQRNLILAGAAAVLAVVIVVAISVGGDDDTTDTVADDGTSVTDTTPAAAEGEATSDITGAPVCPAEDGSSPRTITFAEPHPMCIDASQDHLAVFDTSEGEIRVMLDAAATPITVNNFVTLARWGYYDGTTIFRSDPSIDIIQGGAPRTESPSDPGPGYTIPDEPQFEQTGAGLVGPYRYVPGQLVMARTALPNSSSAQYFFTTGENAALLDGQGVYVVFGETDAAGLEVLQTIIGLHEPGGALGGSPSRTVTINSVTIEVS